MIKHTLHHAYDIFEDCETLHNGYGQGCKICKKTFENLHGVVKHIMTCMDHMVFMRTSEHYTPMGYVMKGKKMTWGQYLELTKDEPRGKE